MIRQTCTEYPESHTSAKLVECVQLWIEVHIQIYIQIVHHYPRAEYQLHCVGLFGEGAYRSAVEQREAVWVATNAVGRRWGWGGGLRPVLEFFFGQGPPPPSSPPPPPGVPNPLDNPPRDALERGGCTPHSPGVPIGQVIRGLRWHNQNTFGPTEGPNEQWREANRRRQRHTIRYRGLVPTPPPPPSRAPSQRPATVPPTPSARFNGICN